MGTVPSVSRERSDRITGGLSPVCYLENSGWGELCLLTALEHPDISFIAIEPDEKRRHVAQYAAEIAAPNLTYVNSIENV